MSGGQLAAEESVARSVVDPGDVAERVRGLLGPESVDSDATTPTVRPTSVDQVASLMRVAGEESWRVRPAGAGLDPRNVWSRPADLEVSSNGLTDELDHAPVDLNVRVGAGVRLGRLSEHVAAGGQWLALDPPGGPGSTVGGVVATGLGGPLRVLYGRPRDQVLGLTLVDGSGRVLSLGGRVVKNVAGFDLVRLATGSRGRLGMITDVTLRLYPQPEEDRTLVWCFHDVASAWRAGRALAMLPFPVAAAELLLGDWPTPIPPAAARVAVRLTGSPATNRKVTDDMASVASAPDRILSADESVAVSAAISTWDGAGAAAFRARMHPNAGEAVVAELGESCERLALHLLEGTIRGTFTERTTEGVVLGIRDRVEMSEGRMELLTGAPEQREGSLEALTEGIRRVFDPAGVLV